MLGAVGCGNDVNSTNTENIEGLWLHFYNLSNKDKTIKDCQVIGLSYDERIKDKNLTVGFEEDEPNTVYINEKQTTYMYQSNDAHWLLYLYFDENDVLEYFTYHCNY